MCGLCDICGGQWPSYQCVRLNSRRLRLRGAYSIILREMLSSSEQNIAAAVVVAVVGLAIPAVPTYIHAYDQEGAGTHARPTLLLRFVPVRTHVIHTYIHS